MASTFFRGRLSRRAAIAAATSLVAATLPGVARGAANVQGVPTATSSGDCSLEPGVQLLIDWRSGLPVISLDELLPPINWKAASHPTLPLFMQIPRDWELQAGWADSYSNNGTPNWQPQPMQVPQLTLARLISPDATAALDYVAGNILGQPLTTTQVSYVARQGIVGEDQRWRSICAYDDPNPLAPSWFTADRVNSSVLISSGTALGLPDLYFPGTTVTWNNLYGPRDQFEELMRTVFIRIFFQFLGGGSPPTPTPTPDS